MTPGRDTGGPGYGRAGPGAAEATGSEWHGALREGPGEDIEAAVPAPAPFLVCISRCTGSARPCPLRQEVPTSS